VLHHGIFGVYRISEDTLIERVIDHPGKPNGIVISPDQKTLYVSYAYSDVYNRGVITAYDILPSSEVKLRSIFAQFETGEYGADGLTVDKNGNLYAALPTRDMSSEKLGVAVYAPSGHRIAFIPVKGGATNVAFGRNKHSHELFITRGPNLYRIKVGGEGYHIPQKTK
jgi:gluconolactonase